MITKRPHAQELTLWRTSLTGLALSEVGLVPQRTKKKERINCGSFNTPCERNNPTTKRKRDSFDGK